MFPFLRMIRLMARARRAGPMAPLATDEVTLRCWPVDIDLFLELNNGRTLTLYDLARFSLAKRAGLWDILRRRKWGLAVAGASTRYRRRIFPFRTFSIRTRVLGWDDKFIYLEQAMWCRGEACNHMLIRTAVVSGGRFVPTADVVAEFDDPPVAPPLPDWALAWIEADATRPWPPDF